jgi:hypothetical protein
MASSIRFVSSKSHLLTDAANRAAYAKGVICDLAIKKRIPARSWIEKRDPAAVH